jgi:hypothetical protein
MRISLLISLFVCLISLSGCTEPTAPATISQARAANVQNADTPPFVASGAPASGPSIASSDPIRQQAAVGGDVTENENGSPTSDSDEPGTYRRSPTPEHKHDHEHTAADPAGRTNVKREDGDDPNAPILISEDKAKENEKLNNGRGGATTPPPRSPGAPPVDKAAGEEPKNVGRAKSSVAGPPTKDKAESATAEKAKQVKKPSKQTLADLPKNIRVLDEDKDGQIGLYEWPKTKIKQFTALDSNSDGFLTPDELAAAAKKEAADKASRDQKERKKSEDKGSDDKQPESLKEKTSDDTSSD